MNVSARGDRHSSTELLMRALDDIRALRKSDDTLFSATHCGMGVPPVIFVASTGGTPMSQCEPDGSRDSTESRGLSPRFILGNFPLETALKGSRVWLRVFCFPSC